MRWWYFVRRVGKTQGTRDENMTQKVLQNEVSKSWFFVFFRGLGTRVSHGGPKEPPRVPIVSLKIPKWSTKVFTN